VKVTRRVWSPDRLDVAIVAEIALLGGWDGAVISRADLAYRVGIGVARLERRLEPLARYGYMMRQHIGRGVCFWVLRVAAVSDVHEVRPDGR